MYVKFFPCYFQLQLHSLNSKLELHVAQHPLMWRCSVTPQVKHTAAPSTLSGSLVYLCARAVQLSIVPCTLLPVLDSLHPTILSSLSPLSPLSPLFAA